MKLRLRYILPLVIFATMGLVGVFSIAAPQPAYAATPDAPEVECSIIDNPFELKWAVCPIVKGLVITINQLDNFINSQLSVGSPGNTSDPNQIFCNRHSDKDAKISCKGYYTAWVSVRNLALGLMVAATLVVLITHALGLEMLDAYTIRKVLPRLLISALGITLSWQLMQFFVTLSNDLAYGVRFLIYQPFAGLDHPQLGGGSTAIGAILGFGALNTIGWIGVFTYLGAAILAVFIAFLVLVLRQLLIIMMIIFAPIAIVAYILPNTNRFFKLWWDSFSKALLMFALISGLIAMGRVFSAVSGADTSNNPVTQWIGFAAYFLPYFFIPATFKLAGGAIRQVGGFVNDRSRGGFDRMRKARGEAVQKRMKAARTGGIYRNDFGRYKLRPGGKQRYLSQGLNTLGNYTYDIKDQGRWRAGRAGVPLLGRTAKILGAKIDTQKLEHSKKAEQDLGLHYSTGRALGGQLQYFTDPAKGGRGLSSNSIQELNDKFGIKDDAGNVIGWEAPEGTDQINDLARILSTSSDKSDSSGALHAAQELRAKSAILGSLKGPGKEETQRADLRTIGLLSAAKAGRLENTEIAAERNLMSRKGDEFLGEEYALATTNLLQDAATQKRASQARGHGLTYDQSGEAHSAYEVPTSDDAQKSLMRLSTQDVAGSKSEDLDETANAWIYGAADFEMDYDKQRKQLKPRYDKNRKLVMKQGKKLEQAAQLRARIKTMSLYNYGDSDVGRKLSHIYGSAGHDPRELYSGGSSTDPRAAERPGAAQPEPPDDGGGAAPPPAT